MLHLKRNLLVLFLLLSFPIFTDVNKNPFELIDIKSQEMVVVLTSENELFNTNPELFKNKIKNIFEPLIDFNRVSASVMGKKYYLSATKEERAEFIEVFKISLLDTYAETLAQWGDAEIFGEVAEYNRNSELIKIEGSPVRFEIYTEDNIFSGFSNLVLIKDDEIEISGSVLIEDKNSRIRGKIIKFNMGSGELQIN